MYLYLSIYLSLSLSIYIYIYIYSLLDADVANLLAEVAGGGAAEVRGAWLVEAPQLLPRMLY